MVDKKDKSKKSGKEVREFILTRLPDHPSDIVKVAKKHFGITRQAVNLHMRELIAGGLVSEEGKTRAKKYRLARPTKLKFDLPVTPDLEEDRVFRERVKPFLGDLKPNVMDICAYGFTEMFNNVIEHSSATTVSIYAEIKDNLIEIDVRDNGVGIFNKIQKDFNLENQRHAILELAKGKLTSDSSKHTGEGIYFTSRMFDTFYIFSGSLSFGSDTEGDLLLEEKEDFEGTRVMMKISLDSDRRMEEVFDKFTIAEEGGFTKTQLAVILAQFEGETLISRSQAKRLLARFDKFKEVLLSFKGVETIGQPFADEVFRVFNIEHPDIKLEWENTTEQVEKMIKRALAHE
jgi:anti-sigma regulatory factor (Ser/Thr protein kinase)